MKKSLKNLKLLKDYLPIKGSETMEVKELRCKRCKRLFLTNLGGDIDIDNSTNMLTLKPTENDIVLEIKCPRCKKYSVIFKLGVMASEHGDQ